MYNSPITAFIITTAIGLLNIVKIIYMYIIINPDIFL